MKIECSKASLLNGVSVVSKAVPSKTTLSILQCILIKASKGVITLTANDMELGIETKIEGNIIKEGNVALDAKFFSEIVRKLPDNTITIDVDDNFVTKIVCENTKFNLTGKDGNEFSDLPKINKVNSILVSEYSLKELIKQTSFCLGSNLPNPIMNSELMHIKDDVLEMVALDGHRIAYRKINLSNVYPETKIIIPGKTLNEIERILSGDVNKEVVIFIEKNHVLFELDNTLVISRLVDGEYFDYEKMLINDYETKVHVNKKNLYESIDRGTLVIREGDKKPIIFQVRDSVVNLSITTLVGNMNEDVLINKSGKDMDIAFNPSFLLDTLKVLDEEEIDLYLVSPKNPCIIKNEDSSYVYLILPVNFVK